MDLNLLPAFLAVYETHSVGAAATKLRMSQPGVSAILRRLRAQFNDPLFIKTPNGMEPTARAKELADPIRQALTLIERQVLTGYMFTPATATDEFNLMLSDVGEYGFLPMILAAVANQAPHVKINSKGPATANVVDAMETGAIDLIIGYLHEARSSNVMQTVLGQYSFGCFVGEHHRWAGQPLSLTQFSEASHVVVNPEGRSQEAIDLFYESMAIERNIVYRTSHFLSVPAILRCTDLIATLPLGKNTDIKYRGLAQIKLPFDPPMFALKMYWHRTIHDDPSHRWFRQLVAYEIGQIFVSSAFDFAI